MTFLLHLALLIIPFFVYAADPVTEVGEKYLEDKRRQDEIERLNKRQDAYQPAPKFASVPENDACFQVNQIVISGNSILSVSDVGESVEKYRNKCLGKEAINQLIQELSAKYIDLGYITSRVYIPPQDLTSGTLELVVIEGYVEAASINNNSSEDRRKLWWAMSPAWGKHLRLPEIEQALDQINRVPSANAQMKLWPGQKTGSTHVQIINQTDDEFRGDISVSNDGQEDTGKMKTRLGLEADNLLGINDNASLNLITSTNTNAITLSGGFPYRWWSFDASHSYSEYLNILPENTDLFGQSNTSTLNSRYLFYRNTSTRIGLLTTLTIRRSERHILGVQLTPQKLVPVRVAMNYSRNSSWGYISGEFGHVQGTGLFGATQDERSAPEYSPLARFQKQDIRLTIGAPLSSLFSLQTVIAGQYSDDSLYSSEQIHLGDAGSVRGSDTTFASGDRGFYIQNTLSVSGRGLLAWVGSQQAWLNGLSFRLFSDYGYVRQLAADHADNGMGVGAGAGYRYRRLTADLWWARLVQSRQEFAGQNIFSMNVGLKLF